MRVDIKILLVYCYFCLSSFNNAEKNESVFVPTKEWQTVKKGTPIPGGLHVRHNFQTGITEAKLMEDEETEQNESKDNSKSKSLALHPDETIRDKEPKITTESDLKFPIKELKARLKNLKYGDNSVTDDNESNKEEIKKKYKSYDTLKKELKAIELNVTNDAELLSGFFKKFETRKSGITTGTLTTMEIEEVLDILNNLEFLVHQIDNAHMFTDMKGMTAIVLPCLNGTNNQIKAEALRLFGAAVQSNPKVQIKALENEFVQKLLHMLSTNNKFEVKSRCLFALGALVRHFPAAQKVLVDHGGLEIFGKILADGHLQVQLKIMKLINDLIIERQDLEKIENLDLRQLKSKDYAATDFEQKLVTHKYCQNLNNLMIRSSKERFLQDINVQQMNSEDYDLLQVLYQSLITTRSLCEQEFNWKEVLPLAKDILYLFKKLNKDISNNLELAEELRVFFEELAATVTNVSHDEL